MEPVSSMHDRDFEYLAQPRQLGGGRLAIRISAVGGGTVGRAYAGRWMYRVKRVGSPDVLAEGDDLNTGTAKTHKQAAEIVNDFLQDRLPD